MSEERPVPVTPEPTGSPENPDPREIDPGGSSGHTPRLVGGRPRPGRAMRKPQPAAETTFTPEQRLLVLDAWRGGSEPGRVVVGAAAHHARGARGVRGGGRGSVSGAGGVGGDLCVGRCGGKVRSRDGQVCHPPRTREVPGISTTRGGQYPHHFNALQRTSLPIGHTEHQDLACERHHQTLESLDTARTAGSSG